MLNPGARSLAILWIYRNRRSIALRQEFVESGEHVDCRGCGEVAEDGACEINLLDRESSDSNLAYKPSY